MLNRLAVLTFAGAIVTGCQLAPPASMRPERADEFRLPPQDDARYSRPMEIPREYLDPKSPKNPFEKDEFRPPPGGMTGGGGGMPGGRPGM
jgi:hypothetical protein